MVKAYLRYVPEKAFGMIAGASSNILYHPDGKHIITSCNEFVLLINIKTGDIVKELSPGDKHCEITYLSISNSKEILVLMAGYSDGDIVLWDLDQYEIKTRLNGHKAAVTAAYFSYDDATLISGGADNNIIVWDILAESALYKLSGHKNAITKLEIIRYNETVNDKVFQFDFILSSSKDGLFKIWDLAIQDCVATVPGVTNEIWSFAVHIPTSVILLGSNTEEIQIIKLRVHYDPITKVQQYYENIGNFQRKAVSRALDLQFDHTFEYLFVTNSEKAIEIYKIITDQEAEKKAKRKKKRLREKKKDEEAGQVDVTDYVVNFLNRFNHVATQHFSKKVRSLAFPRVQRPNHTKLCISLHNNSLEIFEFLSEDQNPLKTTQKFEKLGHRSAVRTVSLSSDDSMILTGSGECVKLWTSYDFQCIRTFESGWATCSQFLPGDKYFVVGDKEGLLTLYDIDRAEKAHVIQAHEASIWSLHLSQGTYASKDVTIMTGSADRKIKFWNIQVNKTKGTINLNEVKALTMADEIHCVKFSADGKYYAAALMDSTMKIYFTDSDKMFLSLYGHNLPVLSFDISTDGTLIVSGSADKNVKLWGMDFGNCKKSIFAHQDSVMKVQFVKDTHYFFSVGKDRNIKYWDGDSYQLILDFEFHLGEVWALAISSIGDFFVSASNDKSIRLWKQTKDQVFISEEEERRMEKTMVDSYANEKLKNAEEAEQTGLLAAGEVSKVTVEHLKHGENLIEALEKAEKLREEYVQYELSMKDYMAMSMKQRRLAEKPEKPNTDQLLGKSIPEFILSEINKIRPNDLESCLKFLHFAHMEHLLYYLKYFISNNINIELSTRILYFILQAHENHIKNSKKLSGLLVSIQKQLRKQLEKEQRLLGLNISGMKMVIKGLKDQSNVNIEQDSIFTQKFSFL